MNLFSKSLHLFSRVFGGRIFVCYRVLLKMSSQSCPSICWWLFLLTSLSVGGIECHVLSRFQVDCIGITFQRLWPPNVTSCFREPKQRWFRISFKFHVRRYSGCTPSSLPILDVCIDVYIYMYMYIHIYKFMIYTYIHNIYDYIQCALFIENPDNLQEIQSICVIIVLSYVHFATLHLPNK